MCIYKISLLIIYIYIWRIFLTSNTVALLSSRETALFIPELCNFDVISMFSIGGKHITSAIQIMHDSQE